MSSSEFYPHYEPIPYEQDLEAQLKDQEFIQQHEKVVSSENELFAFIESSTGRLCRQEVHHEIELSSKVSENLTQLVMDSQPDERELLAKGLASCALATLQDFADTLNLTDPIEVAPLHDYDQVKITQALSSAKPAVELDEFYYQLYNQFTDEALQRASPDGFMP